MELDSGEPTTHHYYASLLMAVGRHSEAISEMESAVRLDPLSSVLESSLGRILYRARKYDEAIPHFMKALELDPRNYGANIRLGDVYVKQGKYEEAIAQFKHGAEIQQNTEQYTIRIALVYSLMNRRREALQMVSGMNPRASDLAAVYVALGDKDEAFRILNRAIDAHDSLLVFFKEDPTYDDLRSDPRWKTLLQRMNFPLN